MPANAYTMLVQCLANIYDVDQTLDQRGTVMDHLFKGFVYLSGCKTNERESSGRVFVCFLESGLG